MDFDLRRLIEDEREDRKRQNKEHAAIFKKNRRRIISYCIAGGTTLALLVSLAVYDPFTQSLRWGSGPTQVTTGDTPTANHSRPEWFQEQDNKYPVSLETWQKNVYDSINSKALANTVLAAFNGQTIVVAAQVLPSTSTGYTDDSSKAYSADGSKNMLYSLWTQENFSASAIVAVERLINPVFGGWSTESRTNDLASIKSKLADLFTGDFALPVLTDSTPVTGFTLGDGLPSNGAGWVGTITGWTVEFTYDHATLNYTANVHVSVAYAIWKNDKSTATTTGDLALQLVPNLDAKTQTDRVLISSATLTLGGRS